MEVRIPFSYFVGKRLALRYTHSLTLFLHKVIFPVDDNIKKSGNICGKMKIEAAFEYM